MSLTLTLERGGGEVSGSGTNIELDGTIAGGSIESVEMYGDTQQQTYSGKNLLPITNQDFTYKGMTFKAQNGVLYVGGTSSGETSSNDNTWKTNFSFTLPAGTYTASMHNPRMTTYIKRKSDNYAYVEMNGTSVVARTFTLSEETELFMGFYMYQLSFTTTAGDFQIEKNSTATSFEPYVGGTASPNPDYPQEVKTVTGEQTITISDGQGQSQTYPIDLGDIELCKIGTYKDVIFKNVPSSSYYSSALDDGAWYVHKELSKIVIDGSQSVTSYGTAATGKYRYSVPATGAANVAADVVVNVSDKFVGVTRGDTYANVNGMYQVTGLVGFYWDAISTYTTAQVQTWLSTNNVTAYYPLATPTDTQITNSALIAQLEALNEATTYDGTTVITVSSENLASPLEVTVSSNIAKTYTEVEIGSPFTITDVEGKSSNTTLDGNVYVDWAYNKKQYSFDLFNLTPQDYADIRAFYDYQFNNSAFPTITVPELNIDKLPVYMEISSRNIINQCLLTDKLTLKFRETVQP